MLDLLAAELLYLTLSRSLGQAGISQDLDIIFVIWYMASTVYIHTHTHTHELFIYLLQYPLYNIMYKL
jgi:hypothetical protein